MSRQHTNWREPSFTGLIGVARRDVTPPKGIYARSWGAAEHDVAAGVHRPLLCTVLTLRAEGREDKPLVLAAIDAGWFRGPEGAEAICGRVRRELGLPDAAFMLALSHTHAGPSVSPAESDKPGGGMIAAYVDGIGATIVEAAREAVRGEQPAVLTLGTGRCAVASERDLPDPAAGRFVCGFNPGAPADDVCLVGRVARVSDGAVVATIVNYACHPTTLAWENRLISPDFVGAMRETVERGTGGAPCLFLQGASGELAPRQQYCGDTAVADAHGRSLGYAALSVIEEMLPPNRGLKLEGVVESGAPLAVWRPCPVEAKRLIGANRFEVDVPLKNTLRREEHIAADLCASTDRAARERLHRELLVLRTVGSGMVSHRPMWMWKVGDVLLLGQSDEAYSQLQRDVRAAFPEFAVVVMNVVNGWGGYLCPSGHYERQLYQVQQSPYAKGCLEAVIAGSIGGLRDLIFKAELKPSEHLAAGRESAEEPDRAGNLQRETRSFKTASGKPERCG